MKGCIICLVQKNDAVKKLMIGWLVMATTYTIICLSFFAAEDYDKRALSLSLILVPYVIGAIYYAVFCKNKTALFYTLGLLLPCFIERLMIYGASAYYYHISLFYPKKIMRTIADEGSNIGMMHYETVANFANTIVFFNWHYVIGGTLFTILLTMVLTAFQKSPK